MAQNKVSKRSLDQPEYVFVKVTGAMEKRKEKRQTTTEFEWIITDFASQSIKPAIFSPTFYFVNTRWNLVLIFKPDTRKSQSMVLQLNTDRLQCLVKYRLGLKKVGNSVEHLSQGILKENRTYSDECCIKLSELQKEKYGLGCSNTLIITCTFIYAVTHYDPPKTSDLPQVKKLKRLNTLSDNFRSLFANKDTCDTALHVKDNVYKAHRSVLIARSPVFAAMFLHETSEKQTGVVSIPDCDPDSFEEFLEFLYTGKLEKAFSRSAFQLYEVSDKYDVQELKTFCVEFLIESLTIKNLCDTIIFGYKYGETDILSAAQKIFSRNVNKVLESNEWDSLVQNNYSLSKEFLKSAWRK